MRVLDVVRPGGAERGQHGRCSEFEATIAGTKQGTVADGRGWIRNGAFF